jgi:hypothetical protein
MDYELYMLRIRMQANTLYLKIKLSREELEQKHPHRTDLLESMRDGERMAVESYEFIRLAQDEIGSLRKTLNASHLANIKLEAEVRELRQKNALLLDKINL